MAEATETDQIERDLEKTRARMDSRLEELQNHLSPGQLVNDAFAYFKGGDGADFTRDVLAKIRANPVPAALTGIGLVWLMVSNARSSQVPRHDARQEDLTMRLRTAEAGVIRQQDEHPDAYSARVDEARGKVLGIVREPNDTATSFAQRIKDAMASAAQSVRETTHDLSAAASHGAARLGDQAQRGSTAVQKGMGSMAQSTRETLASATSNPLVLGAVAAVVGLVAGSLIPTSVEEERTLGATADKLRTAGRGLAQDVVDRGARAASEAIAAAKDSAQAHGLSSDRPIGEMVADLKSGALAGAVKDVAGEAISAGRDSVQDRSSRGSDAENSPGPRTEA